jgi:hypothetical protein
MSDAEENGSRLNETVKELTSEERMRRQELRSDAEVFQTLIKHPGWPRYMAMIEKVGNNFNIRIMQPLPNMDAALGAEHAKGALYGLSLAAQLPSAKIREAADLKSDGDGEN